RNSAGAGRFWHCRDAEPLVATARRASSGELRLEDVDRHRLAEQEALEGQAAVALEEAALRLGLDPFGDDGEAEALGQRDDRVRDRRVVGPAGQVAYDRAVDLDLVERQPREIGERRIA